MTLFLDKNGVRFLSMLVQNFLTHVLLPVHGVADGMQ